MSLAKDVGIHLNHDTASQLWQKYNSEFARARAYVASKEGVKDKAAYFRRCLEQGWLKDAAQDLQNHDPYDLNLEEKRWYEWASN